MVLFAVKINRDFKKDLLVKRFLLLPAILPLIVGRPPLYLPENK
jgi:hypothetical protein